MIVCLKHSYTPSDNSGSVTESLPQELCLQEPGATIQV